MKAIKCSRGTINPDWLSSSSVNGSGLLFVLITIHTGVS